jgi:hypothetical protein
MTVYPVGGSSANSQTVTNSSATNFDASINFAGSDRNNPAPVATGNRDYYENRRKDFERRNPGMTPPAYYMEYGDKYAKRFSDLNSSNLSPAGLAWRDRTLKALQEAIETKRREDPAGFAALERNPEAFKAFAYGTHPNAYIKSGLFDLSAQDLSVIATTPDIKDVLSQDGMKGWWDTMKQMRPGDVADIAKATWKQATESAKPVIENGKEWVKDHVLNPVISGPWKEFDWNL